MPVAVQGLRELNAAFAKADKQTRLGVRAVLRDVAEPVRRDAETLAAARIPRMQRSPRWSRMRVGVTRNLVYVAPRQRGTRRRGDPRSRPNLAPLLMNRAMQPALDAHAADTERAVEHALDRIADDFNHGGPV
jgi:hypothetical protein